MSLLDRYVSKGTTGPVLWLGLESTAQLKAEIVALEAQAQACPNVVTGAEGTAYCALAESTVKKLTEERDALRKHAEELYDDLEETYREYSPWSRAASPAANRFRTAYPKDQP